MTTSNHGYRVRRAFTAAELDTILTDLTHATSTADLLVRTVRAVFGPLLADHGATLDDYTAAHRLDQADYAIPVNQWQVVAAAAIQRAVEWGTGVTVSVDIANVMPSMYDDPAAPVPAAVAVDRRPLVHELHVARDATDVIAAAESHIDALGRYYGQASDIHLEALTSWHHQLARLFSMAFGARTKISRDGSRSLFVHTASGFTFAVIFHGSRRHCTEQACAATIRDDGTACPPRPGAAILAHDHTPSYPLDAPQPGHWSFHS
ncbi:hypothetical protein [Polymorphospora sp. NPDC050346]|uniref:hypothetical protein n=1 Tax=Polymorphospora sp. NPDC050346 TaxID=3155780 RepID=UPI0033CC2F0E